jgi:hypothetical protein
LALPVLRTTGRSSYSNIQGTILPTGDWLWWGLGDVHVEGSSVLCRLISHGVRAYVAANYAGGWLSSVGFNTDGQSTWLPTRRSAAFLITPDTTSARQKNIFSLFFFFFFLTLSSTLFQNFEKAKSIHFPPFMGWTC